MVVSCSFGECVCGWGLGRGVDDDKDYSGRKQRYREELAQPWEQRQETRAGCPGCLSVRSSVPPEGSSSEGRGV